MAPEPGAEMRLLLACATPGENPLPALDGIDWTQLGELADRHRMTLLLGRRLLGRGMLPESAEAWLTGEVRSGSARALAMTAELARITGALEGAGVPVAAYKGPALGAQAYDDAALRWCSDLDLLVEPGAVPRAMPVLAGLGYAPLKSHSPAQEEAFRLTDGDYPLRHAESGTLIELHCHVSPPRFAARFDSRELLRRRVPVPLGPFRVHALSPKDLLPALAVHGAKHRWARLEWLAAFAGLLQRSGVETRSLIADGDIRHAGTAVRVALELCRSLLAMPGREPATGRVARLAVSAAARMLGDQPRYTPEDTADNLRFNLQLCDSPRDRLRTGWRWLTLPTPEDWAWLPLPDRLFPAYRLVRPARLLARYGIPGK